MNMHSDHADTDCPVGPAGQIRDVLASSLLCSVGPLHFVKSNKYINKQRCKRYNHIKHKPNNLQGHTSVWKGYCNSYHLLLVLYSILNYVWIVLCSPVLYMCFPRVLCSSKFYIPGVHVTKVWFSQGPMFLRSYVPGSYFPMILCLLGLMSQGPMFPKSFFLSSYAVKALCSWGLTFPRFYVC